MSAKDSDGVSEPDHGEPLASQADAPAAGRSRSPRQPQAAPSARAESESQTSQTDEPRADVPRATGGPQPGVAGEQAGAGHAEAASSLSADPNEPPDEPW